MIKECKNKTSRNNYSSKGQLQYVSLLIKSHYFFFSKQRTRNRDNRPVTTEDRNNTRSYTSRCLWGFIENGLTKHTEITGWISTSELQKNVIPILSRFLIVWGVGKNYFLVFQLRLDKEQYRVWKLPNLLFWNIPRISMRYLQTDS